jgi:pilus assembly protein CpaB
VTKTALRSLDGLSDKVTSVELLPGEQLVAERLIAPEELKTSGAVEVPEGLQEISFQLDPQRVVGGKVAPGDHVGVFISMKAGGIEAKSDKETTQLSIHKVLVTGVQRAPVAAPTPQPSATGSAAGPVEDTSLPTGMLLLTVAVNDVNASKIVFASEFATLWLSKEPLDAQESGPGIMQKSEVYK